MSKILFTIYDDYIIIDNITLIKEFNDFSFRIDVDNIAYEITGNNLILSQVSNDNKTIKINPIKNNFARMNFFIFNSFYRV